MYDILVLVPPLEGQVTGDFLLPALLGGREGD